MNFKDVERRLEQRMENLKMMDKMAGIDVGLLLGATLADLRKAMYAQENPESSANSYGLCPRCGGYIPKKDDTT